MRRVVAIVCALVATPACGAPANDPSDPDDRAAAPVEIAEVSLPPPPAVSNPPVRKSVAEAPPLVPRPEASAQRDPLTRELESIEAARRAALGPTNPSGRHRGPPTPSKGPGMGASRRGKVTLGQVTHSGIANGAEVAEKMLPTFRTCYRRELRVDNTAKGTVELVLTVDQKGEVTSVRPSRSALPQRLLACLTTGAKFAVFVAPTQAPATVRIPLTFESTP